MSGSTARARSGTRPAPTNGYRHLYLPRRPRTERTGRLLLLAIVLDRPGGHPNNVAASAKMLGRSRPAVRAWRDSLLADKHVVDLDGFLVPGSQLDAWRTATERDLEARGLQFGFDPVPRRLLPLGLSPAILHAAALVYADAIGLRHQRRYCRSDTERAALAGVTRETVVEARSTLKRLRLVEVKRLRRGRADLRRVQLAEGAKATHASRMSETRAARLADRAAWGRLRRPGRGNCTDSEGANCAARWQPAPSPAPRSPGARTRSPARCRSSAAP